MYTYMCRCISSFICSFIPVLQIKIVNSFEHLLYVNVQNYWQIWLKRIVTNVIVTWTQKTGLIIFYFSLNLTTNSPDTRLVIRAYFIEENGVIPHQGEMINVTRGDVKISVELQNWVFAIDTLERYRNENVSIIMGMNLFGTLSIGHIADDFNNMLILLYM